MLAQGKVFWWGDMPYDDVYRAVAEILGVGTEIRSEIDKTLPNLLEGMTGSPCKITCGNKHMAVLTSNKKVTVIFLKVQRRERYGRGVKMSMGNWEPKSTMRKPIAMEIQLWSKVFQI